MALTDDQRAMLRLLAQNDDSYEDIAALKGVSVEQVRSEVKAALAAAAAEQEAGPPEQPPPAEETPPPPSPPQPKPKPAPKPPRKPKAPIPPQRRRLLIVAAAAIAVVGVALIAIALIDGSGSSGSSGQAEGAQTAANGGSADKKLTRAELKPVDGSSAKGQAIFGRLKKKIVLLVEAVGLEPSAKGQSYTIWLYKSPKLAIRVTSVRVTKSGGIRVPVQLDSEIFGAVLARVFDRINISRTSDAVYEREVAQAKKQNKLPRYTGETVLSGEVTGPVLKKK